jgi:aminopeptidase N
MSMTALDRAAAPEPALLPKPVLLADYTPPPYLIDRVDLTFELGEAETLVRSRLMIRPAEATAPGTPLVLDGKSLELISIMLDGHALQPGDYLVDGESLTLQSPPQALFVLLIETRIKPQENTELEGLYKSGGMFCTQCEAEGFRRITYYLDRPDVMARFSTTILADVQRYPVLLSNGNKVGAALLEDGKTHFARWEDPFPKPAYLFALVAGDLVSLDDNFVTRSGREIALQIFTRAEDRARCDHAMASLKRAMRWDEDIFGLEYDLDVFMIVAVGDFNMGAMENKGLNVFNTKYVLARPETATDGDYHAIEAVIGHEYFHNWTGNRVTCRDWFQLSLKEGLTVLRDQLFSADMQSAPVERISQVRGLRASQFLEDASPMAHPVRPDSYIEISNFYTATVYSKGAEVVRMMRTLLGPERFRKGMDLYFARHDGQAVTCDDFASAMEDASGVDLTQFRLWYSQAGTPELTVTGDYDEQARTYTLEVAQHVPPTPRQPDKKPMHIPFAVGLLDGEGREMAVQLEGEAIPNDAGTRLLDVKEARQRFRFVNVAERPTPSLLRGFSAPVKLQSNLGDSDLLFLMAHDGDPFARWEAGQQLASSMMLRLVGERRAGKPITVPLAYIEAVAATLEDSSLDPAFVALAVTPPSESYIAELMPEIDVDGIHVVRELVMGEIGEALRPLLIDVYEANRDTGAYVFDAAAVGRRSLKDTALEFLMSRPDDQAVSLARSQLDTRGERGNMTDSLAALRLFAALEGDDADAALDKFYRRWRDDALVMDKWFAIQALSPRRDTVARVEALQNHPAFEMRNPNKVYALIRSFAANAVRFHELSGNGYRLLSDFLLKLDPINGKVAARLAGPFGRWRRYDAARQGMMRAELERIVHAQGLSKDTFEIASKSLDG